MKALCVTIALACLMGCASSPSPQIRQAAQKYHSVNRSMSREEVYRILGEPQSRLSDGREQWRVSDKQDTAELLLRFSSDGEITEMEQRYPMVAE